MRIPALDVVQIIYLQRGWSALCYRKSVGCRGTKREREESNQKFGGALTEPQGKLRKMDARASAAQFYKWRKGKCGFHGPPARMDIKYRCDWSIRTASPCPLGPKTRFSRRLTPTHSLLPPNWGFKWDYLLASAAIFAPAGINACGCANRRFSHLVLFIFSRSSRGGRKPLRESERRKPKRKHAPQTHTSWRILSFAQIHCAVARFSLSPSHKHARLFVHRVLFFYSIKKSRNFALKYHEIRPLNIKGTHQKLPLFHFCITNERNSCLLVHIQIALYEWCFWHWQWVVGL